MRFAPRPSPNGRRESQDQAETNAQSWIGPYGLTLYLTRSMVFHMKTTLIIPDPLMRRLKREAAKQRTTISALVEQALRLLLEDAPAAPELPPLPRFGGGRATVDVANREALYSEMERS